jgi:alanyl-tRNA synthetase
MTTPTDTTTTHQRITSAEIARRYRDFFVARGHHALPDMPLVQPEGDTLFVIAGMQPLMPYLLGRATPPAPRLVGLQRCLRTDDVELVGTNNRKISAFQMLGNWSIGDYGRRGAVELAVELLRELGVDRSALWVTTFAGDPAHGLTSDDETVGEWLRVGVPRERIVPLGMDDNFWTTGGPGPCGPDTELFVDLGEALGCGQPTCRPGCACDRFLEFWNLVFIEFEQVAGGRYVPLPLRSVDTGMGLERIAAILQGVPSVFETDLFAPALEHLRTITPGVASLDEPVDRRARRMLVDHVRAALFIWLAGVTPDRDGRGSVLRRMIRRAALQGRLLGVERPFLGELIAPLAQGHGDLLAPGERDHLPELRRVLEDEERGFARVLTAGLRELDRLTAGESGRVPGEELFRLHAERGFPADLAAEILAGRGLTVEWEGYHRALDAHRTVSRADTHHHAASADTRE